MDGIFGRFVVAIETLSSNMDGILGRLLTEIETLNSNVELLTEATRNLAAMQVTGRRHVAFSDRTLETEYDMSRVFDELYVEGTDGKVSRAEIIAHFKDCENPEIAQIIDRYDLANFRSKGYRAFIDYARTRADREKMLNGGLILYGISMKKPPCLDTPKTDMDSF